MSRGPFTDSRRLRFSLLGFLGTAGVHCLLLLPLILTLSQRAPAKPNRSGAGGSAISSTAEPVMTVVFVNEPSSNPQPAPTIDPKELASRGLASKDLALLVLSLDSAPAVDTDPNSDSSPSATAAPDDPAQHAMMFGRYVGQVQARIQRAWSRPRSDIGAPQFKCRARIEQDRSGAVINVKLDHCNGTQRWQQSLASAIRTASPLPAPPDPSVYADLLSLVFSSSGYSPDVSPDGFEPAGRSSQQIVPVVPSEIRGLAERAGFIHPSGASSDADVLHLTIMGGSQ